MWRPKGVYGPDSMREKAFCRSGFELDSKSACERQSALNVAADSDWRTSGAVRRSADAASPWLLGIKFRLAEPPPGALERRAWALKSDCCLRWPKSRLTTAGPSMQAITLGRYWPIARYCTGAYGCLIYAALQTF